MERSHGQAVSVTPDAADRGGGKPQSDTRARRLAGWARTNHRSPKHVQSGGRSAEDAHRQTGTGSSWAGPAATGGPAAVGRGAGRPHSRRRSAEARPTPAGHTVSRGHAAASGRPPSAGDAPHRAVSGSWQKELSFRRVGGARRARFTCCSVPRPLQTRSRPRGHGALACREEAPAGGEPWTAAEVHPAGSSQQPPGPLRRHVTPSKPAQGQLASRGATPPPWSRRGCPQRPVRGGAGGPVLCCPPLAVRGRRLLETSVRCLFSRARGL